MENETFLVPLEAAGLRLDYFLAQKLADKFSRTKIKELIEAGKVELNGTMVKAHTKLEAGNEIKIVYDLPREEPARAENIPIEVVYEDEDLIVVNKPAGMVVHPACGNLNGTLVNALLYHSKTLSQVGDVSRPGIIHRLDKDTSGIMVVAKNDRAHRILAKQFSTHTIERVYWVAVRGSVQHDEMICEEPLAKSAMNRKKVIVAPDRGKEAKTNFRVLERSDWATLLEARPETGRTHQIRVHLKTLGYPVLGDLVYGVMCQWINRQALHAKSLGFTHPTTQKRLFFDSRLPADFKVLLNHLGFSSC